MGLMPDYLGNGTNFFFTLLIKTTYFEYYSLTGYATHYLFSKFRHNIVKVAVDPQTTLTML